MTLFKRYLAIGAVLLGLAQSASAIPVVMAGSDYFHTLTSTRFLFSPIGSAATFTGFGIDVGQLGTVDFKGMPIDSANLDNTDTIVRRLEDADLANGQDTIAIQLIDLSLKSLDPVHIGGQDYMLMVRLNNNDSSRNRGQMTITGDAFGGTFDSFFDVFVDLTLMDSAGNTDTVTVDLGTLSSSGTPWSSIPTGFLRHGGYPDLEANRHDQSPLPPADYVDFFLGVNANGGGNGNGGGGGGGGGGQQPPSLPPIFIIENHPSGGVHIATKAPTPGVLPSFLMGFAIMMGLLRRRGHV